mgnify:CR=1 FL=1
MKKPKRKYSCNLCGSFFSKWTGQCPRCYEWDCIEEYFESEIETKSISSGNILEFDRLSSQIK